MRVFVPANTTRGQMMIMFALMLTVLVAMVALTVDIGFGLVVRRSAQNLADATALAGTKTLGDASSDTTVYDHDVYYVIYDVFANSSLPFGGSSSSIQSSTGTTAGTVYVVAQYTDSQGSPLACPQAYVGNTATPLLLTCDGITSTVTLKFQTAFAGVIGFPTITSSGTATAVGKHVLVHGSQGLQLFVARWGPPFGGSTAGNGDVCGGGPPLPASCSQPDGYYNHDVTPQNGCEALPNPAQATAYQCKRNPSGGNGNYPKAIEVSDPYSLYNWANGKCTWFLVYDGARGSGGPPVTPCPGSPNPAPGNFPNGKAWQAVNVGPYSCSNNVPQGPDYDWGYDCNNVSSSFKGFIDHFGNTTCQANDYAIGEGVAVGQAPVLKEGKKYLFPLIDDATGTGANWRAYIYATIPLKIVSHTGKDPVIGVYTPTIGVSSSACGSTPDPTGTSPFVEAFLIR